jgi:hypothetical protein
MCQHRPIDNVMRYEMSVCSSHFYKFTPQGNSTSVGICTYCGNKIIGNNGFPDDAYAHENTFNLTSNPLRARDNDIERILADKRYPHIFNRRLTKYK